MDGGADDDNLVSDSGADTLLGGAGRDSLNDIGDDDGRRRRHDRWRPRSRLDPRSAFGDDAVSRAAPASTRPSSATATTRSGSTTSPTTGAPGETKNLRSDLEVVDGGGGSDTLVRATPAPNTLRGGPGNDIVDGGRGRRRARGWHRRRRPDRRGRRAIGVDYPEAAAQRISLDGVRDDGAAGELDNVRADVEDVAAGPGDDNVVGNGAANVLDGGTGDDRLDGGAATTSSVGGSGADTLLARDGLQEKRRLRRADATAARATRSTCSPTARASALSTERIADADGDGAAKPGRLRRRQPGDPAGRRSTCPRTASTRTAAARTR